MLVSSEDKSETEERLEEPQAKPVDTLFTTSGVRDRADGQTVTVIDATAQTKTDNQQAAACRDQVVAITTAGLRPGMTRRVPPDQKSGGGPCPPK